MTNSPPDNEAPVTLRAATQLGAPMAQQAASAPASATSVAAPAGRTEAAQAVGLDRELGGDDLTVATLAMSGMVVLASGWLVRRRRMLAQPHEPVEMAQPEPEPMPVAEPEVARVPEHLAQAQVSPEPDPAAPEPTPESETKAETEPVMAAAAVANAEPDASLFWAPDSDTAFNSSWAVATAPMPRRASWLGVATQKRLIKSLMWLRAGAGGAAILAAIAVVVFWLIETTDRRAGETGLSMPLLLGAVAGWALSWGAGQLANTLHRMFFNRVHPKFDT